MSRTAMVDGVEYVQVHGNEFFGAVGCTGCAFYDASLADTSDFCSQKNNPVVSHDCINDLTDKIWQRADLISGADDAINSDNAAQSAGGTGTPENTCMRTGATSSDRAFFTSGENSMGLCGTEASSDVEGRCLHGGSSKSRTVPPIFAGTEKGGFKEKTCKEAVMPTSIFCIRDDVPRDDLYAHVRALNSQMLSVSQSLGDFLCASQKDFQELDYLNQVGWLQQALAGLVEAQALCCERLEAERAADNKLAGDAARQLVICERVLGEKDERIEQLNERLLIVASDRNDAEAQVKKLKKKLRKKQARIDELAGALAFGEVFEGIKHTVVPAGGEV